MSLNLNRVFIAGNLTRDPQVRFLANEKAVAQFGLAVNRRWKNASGEQQEETTFVDIEAWGRCAELCGQYLTKGSPAYIEGRLKLDTWEDKKDGSKRSKLQVVADNVQFLGGGKRGEQSADGAAPERPTVPSRATAPSSAGDEEPPFMRLAEFELG